ncbi:MAG: sugar transferase [Anaerolineales bacterium]|nr:sugar transferase [Anaerolineales bacterium]
MSAPLYLLIGMIQAVCLAALTILIERILAVIRISDTWRYRVAFLLGGACSFVPWYTLISSLHPLWMIFAGVMGAFWGGLLATRQKTPLWENNSPPSPEIQKAVMQIHQQVIPNVDPTPAWKCLFDRTLAILALIFLSPLWIITAFLVWFEDPGPLLFVKNSVGQGGITFHQLKFRTMIQGAEEATGPILASIHDMRALPVGRLLRKSHLDELPQLINILKGEMSFVGPRPQRTVLVYSYLQKMPEYAERHRIKPGIAGLAQVAGSYYLTPRQKLRFDRLYIRHISLGFDLKLISLALLIALWYRWQKRWNGRLPRRLIH